LRLSTNVIASPVVRDEWAERIDGLSDGTSLRRLLEGAREIPSLAIELITVGEQTGQLAEMFEKIAEIYDADVTAKLKRLLTLVEPALILGLGAIVGGIIASILTALLALNDVVGA